MAATPCLASLRSYIPALGLRLVIFSGIWLILCEGKIAGPAFALPTIATAGWLSWRLSEGGPRLRLSRVAYYLPFFLAKSVQAGFEVLRLALAPRLSFAPGFLEFSLRLPAGQPTVFFANIITLLPGTISTELRGPILLIHVLDVAKVQPPMLRDLETKVAKVYGLDFSAKREEGNE